MTAEPPIRMPPSNLSAERSLIGSILRDQRIVDEVLTLVKPDDFYAHAHQVIFESIARMAAIGKEIDLVTIADDLMHAKKLDDAGGAPYLADLWDVSPSAAQYRRYSEIVREMAMRRTVIYAGMELSERPNDLGEDLPDVIAAAERTVGGLSERLVGGESVTLQDAVNEAYKRLDAKAKQDGDINGVPTGFHDLDALLCGFQPSELVIVAARPSVGKTAFGMNILRAAAVENGVPTLFVSLEQARVELAERLLCIDGRIDSHRMRRGHLTAQDQEDLFKSGDRLSRAPVYFDDMSVQDVTRIAATARMMHRKKGIRLVVIDYLQLIDSDRRTGSNRQEQVAAISRRLKAIARDLKIPVVALCQVNRGPEDRQSKEPRLSDLRESGAIEQDADTVLMLHKTDEQGTTAQIEVSVAKQRNGPTGKVQLLFEKRYMRFFDYAQG